MYASQIALCNADTWRFIDAKQEQLHPNAQRLYMGKIIERVGLYMLDAATVENSMLAELKASQWDSLEQWFRISFPYIIDAIRLNEKMQKAAQTNHD